MSIESEKAVIFHGDQKAEIFLAGAEIRSWVRASKELMWCGDPQWWSGTAPILFPVCGSPRDGKIRIDGVERKMITHGFAPNSTFSVAAKTDESVVLELASGQETHAVYPYDFTLKVSIQLTDAGLRQSVEVSNTGNRPMPYSVGIHPAFAFAGGRGEVAFERDEATEVPLVQNKLVTGRTKPSGVVDRRVAIDTRESFKLGALCFFDANSRELEFRDAVGQGMKVRVGGFPHLILWAAPGAQFLSVEAWTGHGDAEGFSGSFEERPSTRIIAPGESANYFGEFTPL